MCPKLLTFWTDLADFLHIVLGAIVNRMCDSALADGFMLAGWCSAKHSHVLHCLAQLSGCNAHTTCRKRIRVNTQPWFCGKQLYIPGCFNGLTEAERNNHWRQPRIPIPHVFSTAGKWDLHYLLSQTSQSIKAQLCFAQGYVKSVLNTITLPGLA